MTAQENGDVHLFFDKGTPFPVNSLRDVGVKHSSTNFVLVSDIDLEPNQSMQQVRESMNAALKTPGVLKAGQTPLFVLPTFLGSEGQEHGQAKNKQWLRNMVVKGITKPANLCACSDCHGPTQFGRWFETSTAYPVEFEWFYEPYFVAPR